MPSFNQNPSGSKGFSLQAVLRGTVASLVISVFGAAVLGLVFYFFSLSETFLSPASTAVLFLSVFSGGLMSAVKAENRGIYHGLAVGIAYFLASWLMLTIFFPGGAAMGGVIKNLAVSAIAGGIGGVVGVGMGS